MKHRKLLLTAGILAALVASVLTIDTSSGVIHAGGVNLLKRMVVAMVFPEVSISILLTGLEALKKTAVYAFTGMSLAIMLGMTLGTLSSGILFKGRTGHLLSIFFTGLLAFMRAIHELVWAWLFVASIGLTPFAGIFALAIPYGGMLGRIYADMLKDVPRSIVENLRGCGASKLQILLYGYLPLSKAQLISYSLYRLECALRSSTIMSFVGLGGIGFQIQMSLYDFDFNKTWTFVYLLIIAVILLDAWSNTIRKKLIE